MKKIYLWILVCFFVAGCTTKAPVNEESEVSINTKNSPESESNLNKEDKLKLQNKTIEILFFFDYGEAQSVETHDKLQKLKTEFSDQVSLKYHPLPLSPQSRNAAEATECARMQGQYKAFQNEIFQNYFGHFETAHMLRLGENMGFDVRAFTACLKSGIMREKIEEHKQQAEKYAFDSPPYLVIQEQYQYSEMPPLSTLRNLVTKLLSQD